MLKYAILLFQKYDTMEIKQVDSQLLDQLVPLFDAYRVWYGKPSDLASARDFLLARIQAEESVIYGAFANDDKMKGFVQLYPLFSSTRMNRLWLLNDLFVVASDRGKGISKLLIDQAKKLALDTGAAGLMLETEKSNEIGNNLYPDTGFILDSDFNHYFWTPNE